jgi:hypothetical protein
MGVFPFLMNDLVWKADVDYGGKFIRSDVETTRTSPSPSLLDFGPCPQKGGCKGIPKTMSYNDKNVPWALRHLVNGDGIKDPNVFRSTCWVDRDFTPPTKQAGYPSGQGKCEAALLFRNK